MYDETPARGGGLLCCDPHSTTLNTNAGPSAVSQMSVVKSAAPGGEHWLNCCAGKIRQPPISTYFLCAGLTTACRAFLQLFGRFLEASTKICPHHRRRTRLRLTHAKTCMFSDSSLNERCQGSSKLNPGSGSCIILL
jgi:hypothetical protein